MMKLLFKVGICGTKLVVACNCESGTILYMLHHLLILGQFYACYLSFTPTRTFPETCETSQQNSHKIIQTDLLTVSLLDPSSYEHAVCRGQIIRMNDCIHPTSLWKGKKVSSRVLTWKTNQHDSFLKCGEHVFLLWIFGVKHFAFCCRKKLLTNVFAGL